MRLHKNDTVMVIAGKDKGKTGKILSILATNRALVEKLNRVKRHQKPTQKMPNGAIVEKEASIHLSNLMVYCAKCSKGVRVRMKMDKEGHKKRICQKCGESLGQ